MPPESGSFRSSSSREELVDVRRYIAALRRNIPLIVGIVVVVTGGVIAF